MRVLTDCCGLVEHQEIPEDEAHCPCDDGWDGNAGTACLCDCHDEPWDGTCEYCGRRGHDMYTCSEALATRWGMR